VTLVGSLGLVAAGAGPSHAIVGGRTAFYTDAPYIAAVLFNGVVDCGASQLNDDTLITAAHCFNDRENQDIEIRIGSLDWERGGTLVPVSRIIVNPGYDPSGNDNDIAILKTSRPMPGVRPIALPGVGDDPLPGSDVKVAGWGFTRENGMAVRFLRTADLPVVGRSVCAANYADFSTITANMFCAGNTSVDACTGDSGGPATALNMLGVRVLEGVVSFGEGCARPERPGVFVRVSTYLDWIRNNE
jgi:trypsin